VEFAGWVFLVQFQAALSRGKPVSVLSVSTRTTANNMVKAVKNSPPPLSDHLPVGQEIGGLFNFDDAAVHGSAAPFQQGFAGLEDFYLVLLSVFLEASFTTCNATPVAVETTASAPPVKSLFG